LRILLLNPNTMPEMTALVARVVQPYLPAQAELVPVTGRFGAHYIASRSAGVIAAHAALEAFAEHGGDCDGVYLACFGDPGLLALKEMARIPVIGMAEASSRYAAEQAERFAIVTGGERWGPILHEFVGSIAMLAEACRRVAKRDGAGAVILGGAGLAGLAPRVQPLVDVPVICSAEAGIRMLLAELDQPQPKPREGDLALPAPVTSTGLSDGLSRLLAQP
jgi:Asp/Glu/hydantoin racemase